MSQTETIASIVLDDGNVVRRKSEVEQEREVALADLLKENYFAPNGLNQGPYHLVLGTSENRLLFRIMSPQMAKEELVTLNVTPFRSIIRDYFIICESYFTAIKSSDPYRVEAIDMGRRGIHNEGSDLLRKLLADKISIDFVTARRLFTLICVLHIK
ncbi:MAG: UPF0262 family protein [Rickettsiales bacterium]|nr:UPF0262 family protein [Rickettsiales bacterium]